MNILFLVTSTLGYGEPTIALDFANQLPRDANEVHFVVSATLKPFFDGCRYPTYWLVPGLAELNRLLLQDVVKSTKTDCIFVVDYVTFDLHQQIFGIDHAALAELQVPVIPFDLYGLAESSLILDSFGRTSSRLSPNITQSPITISPSPIARLRPDLGSADKAIHYALMPDPVRTKIGQRQNMNTALGCDDQDKIVFISTAPWQHRILSDASRSAWGRGAVSGLFRLLAKASPRIRVIHVGPEALPSGSSFDSSRYSWFPTTDPEQFRLLLGTADLYVSLNSIATTLCRAISSYVPSLVLINSFKSEGANLTSPSRNASSLDPERSWLQDYLPVYPFMMWPVGWYEFLEEVLKDNTFASTFLVSEILDQTDATSKLQSLLYDEEAIRSLRQSQEAYVESIRSLPRPADVVLQVATRLDINVEGYCGNRE